MNLDAEWYDTCYIKEVSNTTETQKIISNFVERQGESLVGGIVLRQFENLKKMGFTKRVECPFLKSIAYLFMQARYKSWMIIGGSSRSIGTE